MDTKMKNEILTAIQNVDKKVEEIQKEVAKIPEIEKQIAEIPKMKRELAEISKMKIDIRNISRSMAVIEQEHGDKLKALFDAFTIHAEAIEKQNKRLSFCEQKLENHDMEIYTLKTRVQGL